MALQADYEVVWMAEVQLPAPSGTRRYATEGGAVDETGARYDKGLLAPTIRREMSAPTYGVPVVPEITLEVAALKADEPTTAGGPHGANAVLDAFLDVEPRGAVVKIRRLNKKTGTISTRIVGVVNRVSTASDRVRIEVGDSRLDVFENSYPRIVVDTTTFPDATKEYYALTSPIPLHFGAHREHAPARYVHGVDRLYTPGQTKPKIPGAHRYVVGHTMAKAASGGYANVAPFVATAYRGLALGAALANAGEYVERTNWPTATVGGLSATPITVAGGLLGGFLVYEISAWNGVHETHVPTTISASPSAPNNAVRLAWAQSAGAIGYRIRRTGVLIAYVAGGDTLTYDDVGYGDVSEETFTLPTSLTTQVGKNTHEVIFPQAQRSADDQLATVLVDVDATELGWDPDVRGLWHFRDSGVRDSKVTGFQNYLIRSSTIAFWPFYTSSTNALASLTGNNTLSAPSTFRRTDFVDGPYKPVVQFGANVFTFYISDAASTGLARSTLSTRYDFRARTDEDSTGKTGMEIYSKFSTPSGPGVRIFIEYGVLCATVSDGVDTVTVRGQTMWDGAWHTGTVIIDRSLQELRIEVDGVADAAAADISAVGSINTGADSLIGSGFFGQLDWLSVDSNILPLVQLVGGKGGMNPSAIDFNNPDQTALTIKDTHQQGLDLGTSAFEVEIWFKLSSVPAPGSYVTLYYKGGYWLEVQNTGGTTRFRAWVQGGSVGATAINSANTVAAGRWYYATLSVPADRQAFVTLDTVKSGTVNVTGLNVDSASDVFIGAQNAAGFAKFTGQIDEIRISARAKTDAERAEAYYLGKRNLVAQARQLLESAQHGPGLTLNDAECIAAAQAIDAVQVQSPHKAGTFCTDVALVEQRALKEHLGELFKLRGVQARFASDGTLGFSVDAQRSVVAKYGYFDGVLRNALDRPERSQSSIADAVKQTRVLYRRKRKGAGEVDRYTMKSQVKAVLTVGADEPRAIECPSVRDQYVAEAVNRYFGERMILADQLVAFETADESALLVSPGDLVTLDDPISGRAVQTLEVMALSERGHRFGFECVAWASSIYAFVSITPPALPSTEAEPDYSATLPQPIAGLGVTFSVEVQNDGRRVWKATATWTKPSALNVATIVVEWKPIASSVWRDGAKVRASETTTILDDRFDDASSYDFRVYALNKFQLAGPVGSSGTVVGVTTQPDAPTNPDTASSPGSWAIALTATGAGHRTRRWRFAKHPAKNIDYYEWEVYSASPGGTLMGSGRTGGSNVLYQEGGLARGTARYCQVRAVNKSGTASQYSARVVGTSADSITGGSGGDLGDNGAVQTNDAAIDAFTDPEYATGTVSTSSTTFVDIGSCSITKTLSGGLVCLFATVKIALGSSWSSLWNVAIRIVRDGASLGGDSIADPVFSGIAGTAGNIAIYVPLNFIDTDGLSGSHTYKVQVRTYTGTTGGIFTARLNLIELKR